ncbi:PqqD family protein [Mucilaginibacter ginkgonis]|uniref:PqqD family protein n=1 Tax=Mucilaginibacter ginkgonis TaxID=2682091 RepID=A0A6I4HV11_9SPHI|nr:PqqD family protein [Mucilaginibacter ginkgonis]QQL50234.1 PqqD family protein [Mucilaginibacter ginkgonis]
MKIKPNVATSESGLIFNPATGDSFSCNGMASFILAAMKNGETEAQIKNFILEHYDVDTARLDRDWDDLIQQLKQANLLEV